MDPTPRKSPGKISVRFCAYLVLISILVTLAICAMSSIFIRTIDSILLYAGEAEFSEIFSQLERADLDPHGLIPFALTLGFVLVIGLLIRKIGRWAVIPAVLLGVVLLVLAFAAAVWFTDVNGIRFGTVMLSLIDMIRAGAF